MTKLWIGLGVLIVIGALFGALSVLLAKATPEEKPSGESKEEKKETLRAVVHCTGGGSGFSKYRYEGAKDCLAASLLPGGGFLSCGYGCLGLGTCAEACPTGAIRVLDGVAVVEGERCTACGKCVEACPRHIISLEPVRPSRHIFIPCVSQLQGEEVTALCTDGCTGCAICAEACPQGAITVEEGLARIDYEKCDRCGLCVSECPRALIRVEDVAEPPKPEPPKEPKPPREKKPKKEREPKAEKKPKEPREKPPKKPKEPKEEKEKREPLHKLPKLKLNLKPKGKEEKPVPAPVEEVRKEKKEVPMEPAAPVEQPAPEPSPEAEKQPDPIPATEEKSKEKDKEKPAGETRSSAEAFKAFEQAVAAVGEALGEKSEAETPTQEETPAAAAGSGEKTE